MASVNQILQALEILAPRRYALSFDKIGLQVGEPEAHVSKAVVSLDRSLGAAEFAISQGADLLLAHHPLIFEPIGNVNGQSHVGRTILRLIRGKVNFIAAHTNWDAAVGGINDTLVSLLGLIESGPFGTSNKSASLKVVITTPPEDVQVLIDAASAAGAGIVGAYTRCAHFTEGTGTYIGGEQSHPAFGKPGQIESLPETRIEMVLPESARTSVEKAIWETHSYEEPAFDFYRLADVAEMSQARIGRLPNPITFAEFAALVDEKLRTRALAWGKPDKKIKKVAVCGGAADGEWMNAQRAGADAFVTGEVKQHVAVEASESGMAIVAAGHYATEHPGCVSLRNAMAQAVPDVEWMLFEPSPGLSGRPL